MTSSSIFMGYAQRFLAKVTVQSWLDEKKLASLQEILQDMEGQEQPQILEVVTQTDLLSKGQIEQISAQIEFEGPRRRETQISPAIFYFQDLVKSYDTPEGKFTALKKITLAIYQGEILAVLGFSGSGKSTLLNILGLLTSADPGSLVFHDGINYAHLDTQQKDSLRKKDFGFIFQEANLVNHLNALENVALPLRLQNRPNKECVAKAKETLQLFMTSDEKKKEKAFFRKGPAQLSGGQKQRIAAARAMVHEPRVIFADEPTGNLDFDTGKVVMEVLLQAAREKNATVVLVTHNPSQARQYCHRFVWMEGGVLKTDITSVMDNTMRLVKKLTGKDLKRVKRKNRT